MSREHRDLSYTRQPHAIRDDVEYPEYPKLDISECRTPDGSLPDLNSEIPELADFGDRIVDIVTPDIQRPMLRPSAVRELFRLAGADEHSSEMGLHSPVAGLASEENQGVVELRRFEVMHGRDALRIALDVIDSHPKLLRITLLELAENQGIVHQQYDSNELFRQEERGRIMLLAREPDDPIGKKFGDILGWGSPFYGSIDATPTFISAIARLDEKDPAFLETTYVGRDGQEHTMRDALDLSTEWLLTKLGETEEGLLEFKNTAESGGMDSQSWKDSSFAYIHADGSRANHKEGIASLEVQALTFDALYDAASLYSETDELLADELVCRAEELREAIFKEFWIEDDPQKGSYFAMATDRAPDGSLRKLEVRSSSMGRLLNSRLLERDDDKTQHMADSVMRQMFDDTLLSYTGIRTIAKDEQGFRAGGYHTGSVWPWDTFYIADGFERHGKQHLAWNLRARPWNVVEQTNAFPELLRGDDTDTVTMSAHDAYAWNEGLAILHLAEQVPQQIQGWTVSGQYAAKRKWFALGQSLNHIPIDPLEQEILERTTSIDRFRLEAQQARR
jgi:glycogen debranching enzyme